MSGNTTLQRFQKLLLPVFRYVHENKFQDLETYMYKKRYVTHRELLNYLKDNDLKGFRKGLAQHLEPHFDRVLK